MYIMCKFYILFYTHCDNVVNPLTNLNPMLLFQVKYKISYDTNMFTPHSLVLRPAPAKLSLRVM